MNDIKATNQFIAGTQRIERAIIARAREAELPLMAKNIQWPRGFAPIPKSIVFLEIKVQGRIASFTLSREQVIDSWEQLRPDVTIFVRAVVAKLVSSATALA